MSAIAPRSTVARRTGVESGPPYNPRRTASPRPPDRRTWSARVRVHSPLLDEYLKPTCEASPSSLNASLEATCAACARSREDMAPAFIHGSSSTSEGALRLLALVVRGWGFSCKGLDATLEVCFVATRAGAILAGSSVAGFCLEDDAAVRLVGAFGATFGCETLSTRSRSLASASASMTRFVREREAGLGGSGAAALVDIADGVVSCLLRFKESTRAVVDRLHGGCMPRGML